MTMGPDTAEAACENGMDDTSWCPGVPGCSHCVPKHRQVCLVPGSADHLGTHLKLAPRAASCALAVSVPIYKRARTRVRIDRSFRTAGAPVACSSLLSLIFATSVRASSTSEPRSPQTSSV